MKRINFTKLTVFLLILIAFTACNNGPAKVGLLIHTMENERWPKDKAYIVERIEELGGEVYFKLANNNQQTQNNQARQLLDEGVDVLIVVSVDQNKAADIVTMANEKEVPVIAYDRLIRNCQLDYYVTTNSVRVGEVQADYMRSIVPKGNYALINGDKKDNNSMMLFLGQMNVLQDNIESGDIHVIYSEFAEEWTRSYAYAHAKNVLALRDSVDVIICGSDELVYGVNNALEEAGLLGKVKVIGQDSELPVIRSIVNGTQTATIYKPIKDMGYKAAELAVAIAKNKGIDPDYTTESNGRRLVPSYLMEPMLVDENSISSTVIAGGYHKSEEIYK